MLIVDGHLDIAYNVVNYGRDPRQSVAEIRQGEGKKSPVGEATVTLPALRQAGVGLVFATLFAAPAANPLAAALVPKTVYCDASEAHKLNMTQLDYYHRLADEEERVRLVGDGDTLAEVVQSHQEEDENEPVLGLVPLMEGADAVREPEELEYWYERGLRIIGPAWDNTRYAAGAWRGENESLTKEGNHLLEVMAEFGFILDLTHMSEKAADEALDRYQGVVVATHSNARALVPGTRQLSDRQIRRLGERGGVIGIALQNSFLRAFHRRGDPKEAVTLDYVVAHIDHVCQVLGDAVHVGIGSDMDGGFGAADIPAEMDSIADLPLIVGALKARGYQEEEIANIVGGNWLHILRTAFR